MVLKKYFDDALLFEELGEKFYRQLATETDNPLSKKLFFSLAEQEKYHAEMIKNYQVNKKYEKIVFDSIEETVRSIFAELGKELIGKDVDHIAGIEKAMEMEKEGYDLYTEAYNSTQDPDDRAFLMFLIEMEKEHYEGLANLHYYYTDNGNWIAEDEAQVWNWMNL